MFRSTIFGFKDAAIAMVLSLGAMASANAAPIMFEGNDCTGVFGDEFEECATPVIPGTVFDKASPIIIKINFDDDGNRTEIEINPLFSTIDGKEFSFTFGQNGTSTGTWTYTPGDGDPAITAFTAKGGNAFNLFSTGGVYTNVAFFTPNGGPAGLSHISFYDTDGDQPLPEPGSLALLALGLLGLGFSLSRRRSRG